MATIAAAGLASGCSPDPRSKGGYKLSPPPGWARLGPEECSRLVLSGEILEAHDLKPGVLAVLGTDYLPGTKASELVVQMRYLLLNLPSLKLQSEGEISIAGAPAARVDATADGDGRSLAPTTLGRPATPVAGQPFVPTRRVWIKVPRGRERGTLELLLHCPEADYARRKTELDALLASIRLED